MREWRKGKEPEQEYKRMKKEYQELYRRNKTEEGERWVRIAQEAKTEGQMWEIVNKERKRRGRVNEGIEEKEWRDYFMDLLRGVEGAGDKREEGGKREG